MSSRYTTEFRELKKLGRGGFGTVFEAENQVDKKLYAVKKIPIKDGHPGHRDKILREVLALSIMDHPHVVRYFQAWIEDGWTVEQSSSEEESSSEDSVEANATLYIQMKFCPETLQELLESCRKSETFLDDETVWRYFRQIVEGVHYIHEKSFVHRDLSRSNIFLDETKNIQIGDFGLATFLQDRSCAVAISGDAGNLLYIAPELLEEDAQVNEKADIFSLGLLLCDLIFQFATDRERIEVFTKSRQGAFPKKPEILSELLALTPSARPSTSEILQKDLPWREIGLDYARYLENKVQALQTKVCELTSENEELKKMVHQEYEGE